MLELHATLEFFSLTAQPRLFLGRVFATNLDVTEDADSVALERFQHFLEQIEGFALVLLLGVLLRIATQVNTLTQVIHGCQVFFPQIIQYAQQHLLLEGTQRFGTSQFFLLAVSGNQRFQYPLGNTLLAQALILIQPLLNSQVQPQIGSDTLLQPRNIPLFRQGAGRHVCTDQIIDHILANRVDSLFDTFAGQNGVTLTVNHLALLIGNVVVLKQLFANVEVAAFDLALRLFDGIGNHAMLDRLALLHPECFHKVLHPVRGEDAHQVIFQREVETARPRVTLTTRATTQLVIDTA